MKVIVRAMQRTWYLKRGIAESHYAYQGGKPTALVIRANYTWSAEILLKPCNHYHKGANTLLWVFCPVWLISRFTVEPSFFSLLKSSLDKAEWSRQSLCFFVICLISGKKTPTVALRLSQSLLPHNSDSDQQHFIQEKMSLPLHLMNLTSVT